MSEAARACARAADELRVLASRQGVPEVLQTTAATLPGSTTSHVVYDLGVAVSLALGDLAEALADLAGPVAAGAGPGPVRGQDGDPP